jgi:hypothetical protein
MECANPNCRRDAQILQDGTLRLLEMDMSPEDRLEGSDYGFPVCTVPSRFFWLCAVCSRVLRMKRWTTGGLVLEPCAQSDSGRKPVESSDTFNANQKLHPFMDASLSNLA